MFELDQANDNFVSNEQLINKIAEQTGITERTRVPRSQHETKRILIERIERFRPPLFTKTDYESYAMRQLQVKAELLAKKKIYCLQNNLPFNDAESFTLKSLEKNLTKKDCQTTLGVNLHTYNYDIVLPYQQDVKLEDFTGCLEYMPSSNEKSKKISIPSSLPLILDLAEERGFTLKNMTTLLKQIIQEHLPHQYPSAKIIKSDHPSHFFKILINSINITTEIEGVRELVKGVVRHPKENISEVLERAKALHLQLIKLMNPDNSKSELDTKTDRCAILSLQSFVTPATWSKVEKWRDKETESGNELRLIDFVNKITLLERDTKYRPSTNLRSSGNIDYSSFAAVSKVNEAEDSQTDEDHPDDGSHTDPSVSQVFGRNSRERSSRPRDRQPARKNARYRNYSRQYTRTSSYPYKTVFRSPNGTFRNRSTNSSHGRSRSSYSSNTSASSLSPASRSNSQGRDRFRKKPNRYTKTRRSFQVTEDPDRCLRCGDRGHAARDCFRFRDFTRDACPYCLRKYQKLLYHQEQMCYYKKRDGRNSNFAEPSPATLKRRFDRNNTQNPRNNTNRPRRQFTSPTSTSTGHTQYNPPHFSKNAPTKGGVK